jgi:hypothetical protein
LEWLSSLAVVAVDGSIAGMALKLAMQTKFSKAPLHHNSKSEP